MTKRQVSVAANNPFLPKDSRGKKFVAIHTIEKDDIDPEGNGPEMYSAINIPAFNRKLHRYGNTEADMERDVLESVEVESDSKKKADAHYSRALDFHNGSADYHFHMAMYHDLMGDHYHQHGTSLRDDAKMAHHEDLAYHHDQEFKHSGGRRVMTSSEDPLKESVQSESYEDHELSVLYNKYANAYSNAENALANAFSNAKNGHGESYHAEAKKHLETIRRIHGAKAASHCYSAVNANLDGDLDREEVHLFHAHKASGGRNTPHHLDSIKESGPKKDLLAYCLHEGGRKIDKHSSAVKSYAEGFKKGRHHHNTWKPE